jgi:hypothetical protein
MSMLGDTLGDLSGQLLVQCRPGQAKNAARVASAHGSGLVLTGRMPRPTVEALRAHGFTGPILCDANRYSGRRRSLAAVGIRDAWTAEQHELGLVALTDSGYLAPHDWPGLHRILACAARQPGPTIAMLPLSARWFEHSVDALAEEIERHGVPVAVAIEHAKDPFGVWHVARGFLALRSLPVPVLLLRSDVSALGALAHGTYAAAVGTTGRLRHIPPRARRGAVTFCSLRAFVPPLLGHHSLDALGRLAPNWRCDCHECAGAPLTDLADTPRPEVSSFRHSLSAQLTLWSSLRADQSAVDGWLGHCERALARHRELSTTQPGWYPPTNLHSWTQLPHPVKTDRQPAS